MSKTSSLSFHKQVMNGAILRRVLDASQGPRTGAGFDYVRVAGCLSKKNDVAFLARLYVAILTCLHYASI